MSLLFPVTTFRQDGTLDKGLLMGGTFPAERGPHWHGRLWPHVAHGLAKLWYDAWGEDSMTAVKVATSIPSNQFSTLEKVRGHPGLTRSAAVQEALCLWLAAQETCKAAAQYVKGYMTIPEDTAEGDAYVEAWADGMEAEDW